MTTNGWISVKAKKPPLYKNIPFIYIENGKRCQGYGRFTGDEWINEAGTYLDGPFIAYHNPENVICWFELPEPPGFPEYGE